ncbi:hypothetical protein LEP1GSC202_3698 [Leptospira yanagawae serovar Saopaulo str. Sao Paulo = ATCC 700523]|uniref:Uncharacterized protein n=1 Tax=Leptospira yanagawae serovar Saopaulo str. Sao Paulo = ATCC 700523 TaxID=1249483 RepID=A0A5E8HGI3_9LEPT|nr:hypothetical protein LEP1GSC202_3698 [Leptospira yanagawae serovar Saopaulo str. Sao Paulo = ATCC 700523]
MLKNWANNTQSKPPSIPSILENPFDSVNGIRIFFEQIWEKSKFIVIYVFFVAIILVPETVEGR